jgi:opacity protein-like surface antigen
LNVSNNGELWGTVMQNICKLILILSLGFAAAAPLQAELEKGDWDLDFSASYTSLDASGSDLDLITGSVSAGYFVTPMIEIDGGVTYLDADIDGGDLKTWLLEAGANFYFNTSGTFHPYVGGGIFLADVDVGGLGDEDDWGWRLRAGIKQFITDNVTIDYEVSYIDFDDLDLDGIMVGAGLGFHF